MKKDITIKGPASIVLISDTADENSELCEALRLNPSFDFEQCATPLAELNGHASDLAAAHDLVIFQSSRMDESDINAIEEIRRKTAGKAVILALSDENMTLAQVQRLRNSGVDDVFAESIPARQLEGKIMGWLERPGGALDTSDSGPRAAGSLISVAQARGGIGATMLAVNLAEQLLGGSGWRRKTPERKVALVDLDLQYGAVGSFLDVRPNEALYQLAMDGTDPDSTFLSQSLVKLETGLSVLAAPSRIAPLEALSQGQIGRLLDTLRAEFDHVVVDLPRALVEWIAPVLEQSDLMLLVTDTSVPSINQARRLIDFYTEDHLKLPVEMVVNFEKKPLIKARHHAEAEKVLERPLRHWLPYQPKVAREALDRGVPISRVAGRSALAKSIQKLSLFARQAGTKHLSVQRSA